MEPGSSRDYGEAMTRLATLLFLAVASIGCQALPDYSRELPAGAAALIPLGPGEARPDFAADWEGRSELLPALERSIQWMQNPSARRHFPKAGIEHERALSSLEHFRDLLAGSRSAEEFAVAVKRDFTVYRSAGWDGRGGGVLFTAYCTPILKGSRTQGGVYQHPLYGLPEDLEKGPNGEILGWRTEFGRMDYPTRQAIEEGGLLEGRGLELVWLADPIDAYLAHVNGSAFIRLPDGSMLRFGYAGKNGRAYSSLGRELVASGELPANGANLAAIRAWAARSTPSKVRNFLHRNESFVFFTSIDGTPRGSLNVEVTPRRTIATDKDLFTRGAITFVECALPTESGRERAFETFLMDQDTGGAIRSAGRADLYLGVGDEAEALAGRVKSEGQLYYLFLSPQKGLY